MTSKKEVDVIASVGSGVFTNALLESRMPENLNKADSSKLANVILEDWVIEQLMFDKAKQLKIGDKSIDRLVEKYKRSLYIHNFELDLLKKTKFVEFSEDEIRDYYTLNKSQDLLSENIYKLKILLFKDGEEGLRKFEKGWKKDEDIVINAYKPLTSYFLLDTSVWINKSDLRNILPKGFPDERLENTGFQKSKSDDKISYLHIYRLKEKGTEQPYELVKEKIIKILGHKRQIETIQRYKEDLYNKALKNKIIKLK